MPSTHPAHDTALHMLAHNALLLGAFHFDFHKPLYEQASHAVLSYGSIGQTVVIAHQCTPPHSHEPAAYTVRQYDLTAQTIRHWEVVTANQFSGQGDSLEQTIILEDNQDAALTAQLHLSSRGNEWRSGSEHGKLACARLLSYQALYALRLTEAELAEKLHASNA